MIHLNKNSPISSFPKDRLREFIAAIFRKIIKSLMVSDFLNYKSGRVYFVTHASEWQMYQIGLNSIGLLLPYFHLKMVSVINENKKKTSIKIATCLKTILK